MIELKDFVAETVKQIIDGVIEAQNYAKDKAAIINPRLTWNTGPQEGLYEYDDFTSSKTIIQNIDFDVAVAATTSDKGEAGIKLSVPGFFVAGSEIGSQGQNQTISRIKFTVPLVLPLQPED